MDLFFKMVAETDFLDYLCNARGKQTTSLNLVVMESKKTPYPHARKNKELSFLEKMTTRKLGLYKRAKPIYIVWVLNTLKPFKTTAGLLRYIGFSIDSALVFNFVDKNGKDDGVIYFSLSSIKRKFIF